MTNLTRFEFAELGVDVEAAGVGQATIKLLLIDSAKREYVKPIHMALAQLANEFGFSQKLFQRKKQGKFITFFKSILPKIKRTNRGNDHG